MASLQSVFRLPGKDLVSHDWLNKPNMGFTHQANSSQLAPIICQGSFDLSITPYEVFSMGKQNIFSFSFSSPNNWGFFIATCQQTSGVEPAHIPFAGTTLALLGIEIKGSLLSSQHKQARSGA